MFSCWIWERIANFLSFLFHFIGWIPAKALEWTKTGESGKAVCGSGRKTLQNYNAWEILSALYFVMCLAYQLRTGGFVAVCMPVVVALEPVALMETVMIGFLILRYGFF